MMRKFFYIFLILDLLLLTFVFVEEGRCSSSLGYKSYNNGRTIRLFLEAIENRVVSNFKPEDSDYKEELKEVSESFFVTIKIDQRTDNQCKVLKTAMNGLHEFTGGFFLLEEQILFIDNLLHDIFNEKVGCAILKTINDTNNQIKSDFLNKDIGLSLTNINNLFNKIGIEKTEERSAILKFTLNNLSRYANKLSFSEEQSAFVCNVLKNIIDGKDLVQQSTLCGTNEETNEKTPFIPKSKGCFGCCVRNQ